jgi:ribonuclease T1
VHADRNSRWWRVGSKLGLAIFVAAAVSVPGLVQAKESSGAETTISLQTLPEQARVTEKLIRSGGPFPYAKDGVVFGNRERLLPRKPRGFYREYTVPTPGARNRGARRIVCGGEPPTQPEACFYTADHYASFQRIVK